MKTFYRLTCAITLTACLSFANLRASETNAESARIGTYDSRAVAYAWFWSDKHQSELEKLARAARAAQSADDTNRFNELSAALRGQQDEVHREVFSIAPPTAALAELKDRLPDIQKAAGVNALISKWDDATLKKFPAAEKKDVTDDLIRAFMQPSTRQLKTILSIKKSKPLPLDECNELIRKNEI